MRLHCPKISACTITMHASSEYVIFFPWKKKSPHFLSNSWDGWAQIHLDLQHPRIIPPITGEVRHPTNQPTASCPVMYIILLFYSEPSAQDLLDWVGGSVCRKWIEGKTFVIWRSDSLSDLSNGWMRMITGLFSNFEIFEIDSKGERGEKAGSKFPSGPWL